MLADVSVNKILLHSKCNVMRLAYIISYIISVVIQVSNESCKLAQHVNV